MRFLALALLLCALVVPRAAWAEHVGQHGQSFASSEDHVHHDGHVHKVAANQAEHEHASAADHESKGSNGLAHNHLAADLLSVGAEPDAMDQLIETLPPSQALGAALPIITAPASPPNSLLRPPRTV